MPNNGRIIQNIIQGSDLVMSHITHLYHLSALDFINTTHFPGMAPWLPSYTASGMIDGTSSLGSTLVVHYVQALAIRRKCHTAGALFSGRQPIQNALVPGGVSTLFSSTYPLAPQTGTDYDMYGPYNAADTVSKFKSLMTDIRTFINTKYIPDVVTVANAYPAFWSQGVGCGRLLSYGDYPVNASGTLAIKGGVSTAAGIIANPLTALTAFNQADIREYVGGSYYNYGVLDGLLTPANALHPFDGKTTPNMSTAGYSWIKAPRLWNGATALVCEVGPLARMVNSYLSTTQVPASDADMLVSQRLAGGALGASYTVTQLVTAALGLTIPVQPVTSLFSALGRHAARALEAKYIADLMGNTATGWVTLLNPNSSCYTYKRIPKQISTGYGLTEAPRGALGHWIKIEGRKVAKYQCVVPSTWNFSPTSDGVDAGAVEMALENSTIGTNATDQIINILRLVHPFDCCIACAVHVMNPEGKETLKFAIGPDGRPANVEVKE
jgi:hydrogenase large subunit